MTIKFFLWRLWIRKLGIEYELTVYGVQIVLSKLFSFLKINAIENLQFDRKYLNIYRDLKAFWHSKNSLNKISVVFYSTEGIFYPLKIHIEFISLFYLMKLDSIIMMEITV